MHMFGVLCIVCVQRPINKYSKFPVDSPLTRRLNPQSLFLYPRQLTRYDSSRSNLARFARLSFMLAVLYIQGPRDLAIQGPTAETQRLNDLETQRLREQNTQRPKNLGTQRHIDPETERYRDPKTQKPRPRHRNPDAVVGYCFGNI